MPTIRGRSPKPVSGTGRRSQDVATKVTALGGANKGFAMNGWWANYGAFMNAAGGGFFNEDRTACALDTPESIAGLQQVVDIYDADLAVPFGEDGEAAVEGRHRRHVHERSLGDARRSCDVPLQLGRRPDCPPAPVARRATGCSGAPTW